MTRCMLLAALSLVAVACSPATEPVVPAPAAASPPSVEAPSAWEEVHATALGLSFVVPPAGTVASESRSSNGENESVALSFEWAEGTRLSIDRSSREDRRVAIPASGYLEDLRKAAGEVTRDAEVEVAGREAFAIDGEKDGARTWTRVLGVGRSVYTVAIAARGEGGQAIADRIFGSLALTPTSRIYVWKEGRCMVAIPDFAAAEPTKLREIEAAQVLTVKLDAKSADDESWMVMRLPSNPTSAKLDPSRRLEMAIRGIAASGQIDKLKPFEIDGVPGRDVEIRNAQGIFMRIRAFAAGDSIEAAFVSTTDRARLSAPAARVFFESFRPLP